MQCAIWQCWMISSVGEKHNVSSKTVIWSINSLVSWAKWGSSREELTLDNVGDHQRGTAVIAGQTSNRNILLDLEGKQVPGSKHQQFSQIQYRRCGLWRRSKITRKTETESQFLSSCLIEFYPSWLCWCYTSLPKETGPGATLWVQWLISWVTSFI